MDTYRLKVFSTIVECGSMVKAADLLGVSHSGLSKAIKVLQGEVGFKIFRPQGRGLELTEAGKFLYNQSQEVLKIVSQLGKCPSQSTKTTKIGLPEVLALAVSGALLKALCGEVTLDEMDSGEVEAKVLEGKIDFGLTFVPFPHKDLDHLKIAGISFSTYAKKGIFNKMKLNQIPFVVPSLSMRDNPLSIKIQDGWDTRVERLTPYRTNSLAIALAMVRAGECAVFAPKLLVSEINRTSSAENSLVEISTTQKDSQRSVFLVKRVNEEETTEMKCVAKVLRVALLNSRKNS